MTAVKERNQEIELQKSYHMNDRLPPRSSKPPGEDSRTFIGDVDRYPQQHAPSENVTQTTAPMQASGIRDKGTAQRVNMSSTDEMNQSINQRDTSYNFTMTRK